MLECILSKHIVFNMEYESGLDNMSMCHIFLQIEIIVLLINEYFYEHIYLGNFFTWL